LEDVVLVFPIFTAIAEGNLWETIKDKAYGEF
jgi:hypothetical protein